MGEDGGSEAQSLLDCGAVSGANSDLRFLDEELDALEERGLARRLRTVVGAQGRSVVVDGREVVSFSSNNYLGLANHPSVVAAAERALRSAGVGAGASRLIVGTNAEHVGLEEALTAFTGLESALLFNSGYQANLGVIPALVGTGDVVLSDRLNHATLIDGCRLSRARVAVYPHADLAALESLLVREKAARRRLVVSDAVFSMDGDRAPVAALRELCARHRAILMLDEAHSVGVLGPRGAGLAAEVGVEADVQMGTLGKAFGCFGAFVAGPAALRRWLLNRARSFVFTTALPPSVAAASLAALELSSSAEGDRLRRVLFARVAHFADGLDSLGLLAGGAGQTPIFPIVVGDERRTMAACDALLKAGLYAQGIRPPTVPRGTSRLRFALSAAHTEEDIQRALEELARLAEAGLIPRGGRNRPVAAARSGGAR